MLMDAKLKITEEVKTLSRQSNSCFQVEKQIRGNHDVSYEHVMKHVAVV